MRWNLVGTSQQNAIIQEALDRCDFPFETFGEDRIIPVEWADLSRYAEALSAQREAGGHGHIHEGGDTADPIEVRERVLGLAWYSGKVSIEQSLVSNPTLAMEVFLSEGAHMVDFFGMTDEHRRVIWNAVHAPEQHLAPGTDIADGVDHGHGHGWFDVSGYRDWVGEAWMGVFVRAFSDLPVSIPFAHYLLSDTDLQEVRAAFIPNVQPAPYFGVKRSTVYHDSHDGIKREVEFASRAEAEQATPSRRPCRVCRP